MKNVDYITKLLYNIKKNNFLKLSIGTSKLNRRKK